MKSAEVAGTLVLAITLAACLVLLQPARSLAIQPLLMEGQYLVLNEDEVMTFTKYVSFRYRTEHKKLNSALNSLWNRGWRLQEIESGVYYFTKR